MPKNNPAATPETIKAALIEALTDLGDRGSANLAEFEKRFAEDPAYAFEWADGAMQAAARKRACARIVAGLTGGDRPWTVPECERAIRAEVARAARFPKRSTSPISNEMELYNTQGLAEALEMIEAYAKRLAETVRS